jgi:hypothetical protein
VGTEALIALGTVLGVLVGAVAAAAVKLIDARAAHKQQEQASSIAEYQGIVERQEKQVARLEAHAEHQQELIHQLQEANARLRERLGDMRGRYELVYGYARRQAEALRKAGVTPEPAPERPPEPEAGKSSGDLAFEVRQVEQEAVVLKKTRPPGPEGGA